MPKPGEDCQEQPVFVRKTGGLKLPKESLIRTAGEFARCYTSGRRVHTRHFLLFILSPAEEGSVRMGFAVSRKVGHAVQRNRIKRLLREAFRLSIRHLPVSASVVVVAKRQASSADLCLGTVTTELMEAMTRYFHLPQGA